MGSLLGCTLHALPVVPARGGAEVALKIYIRPFSSIELACAVRQPSPCVRALCESGVLFHMSHLKLHFTLHSWQSAHSTLHTSHCTLHTALFALHTPHSSHFTLHSSHSTLHTSHCALHSPHFTLHSSHSKHHTSQYYACSRCAKQPWRSHYNAICKDWVTKHNRTTRNGVGNCSSKTGSRRQSDKKTILNHFLKGILKGKLLAPKWRKSADNSLSQPWCKHSNTIYDLQLQKTIVLRMQPLHQAIPMRFTIFSCKRQ